MPAWALENGGPLGDEQIDDASAFVLTLSPAVQAQSTPQAGAGPLILTASLFILAALVAAAIVIVLAYCRRA